MCTYANQPLRFFRLLGACFANFIPVFKHTWYLVLLAGIFTYFSAVVMQANLYVGGVIAFLLFLAVIFLYAMILLQGDAALRGTTPVLMESFRTAKRRYIRVLGGNVLMWVVALIVGIINWGLLYLGHVLDLSYLFYFIIAIFSLFVTFTLYFAIPIIVTKNLPVLKSFEHCTQLVAKNWRHVFGILIIIHLVLFLIFVASIAIIQSRDTFVLLSWTALGQFFSYPFIVATLLTLIHDSEFKLKK